MHILRCIVFLLLLLMPLSAFAQETAKPQTVNTEAVKQLITTLESDTARTEFISNLKLLLDQQNSGNETEETIAPITQTLGVESFTQQIVDQYQAFLLRNGLKGSTIGKIVLTFGSTGFAFIFLYFIRRAITRLLVNLDKAIQFLSLPPKRLRFYGRVFRGILTAAIIGLTLYSYAVIWLSARNNFFEAEWFKICMKLAVNMGFVLIMGAAIWETINAIIQFVFKKIDGENSARAQTIMPIVRNVLFIVFAVLFALVILSELGINIMPLLAGAGIVGVAIGFGAQTMVKDFITGFTIILEDVVRVGDVAKVAGHEGTVEKITLRKMQLRDSSGRVFTIPFGEITTIENQTKDFSFYPLEIGVSYAADTDKVCDVLRGVSSRLLADETFAQHMLEPIEIMGVDRFSDSAVIIKARLKTKPLQQWTVGREFNRRMKKAFEANGIEMPFPQRVVTVKDLTTKTAGSLA